jgi:HAD superfamily hydrolase (TIGR01509 family)
MDNNFCPSAVIFDMDGLMLDTERPSISIWADAGKMFGYNISQDLIIKTVGVSEKITRAIIQEELGADFPYDKVRDEVRVLFNKLFDENGIIHKKGLINLLDHLAAVGIPHAVATSTRKATAIDMLRKAGILDRFSSVTSGEEVTNGKPAPDVFLLAAERLGLSPGVCVGFEDSPAGLIGLHAAGIRSVFIKDLIEPPSDVLATVWRRYDDLSEAVELF